MIIHKRHSVGITDCQSKKFPFVTLTNYEKQNISFNSTINCKCQTTVSDPNDPTLICDSVNTSDRPQYNTIDVTDTNLEKMTIQSNFKYYQNHDFHKLAQETDSKKVSVLYILTSVLCLQTKNI